MRRSLCLGIVFGLARVMIPAVLACGPVHQWSPVEERTMGTITRPAVEALVHAMEDRSAKLFKRTDRIAVLIAGDDSARGGKSSQASIQGFLATLDRALIAYSGASLVPQAAVQGELDRSGLGASAPFSPTVLAGLAEREKATLFMKIRLTDYGSGLRRLEDRHPTNRGLTMTQRHDSVSARVSLQEPDGQYRLIDEVVGACSENFLLFLDTDGTPASFVEVYLERPGQLPFSWSAGAGHRHFEL